MTSAAGAEETSFEPGPRTELAFRRALGRFVTGVAVVTAATPRGPLGITVNSFASVSLDPPLVLWCPARRSRRFSAFAAAELFAIHVLAGHQVDIARRLAAGTGTLEGMALGANEEGVPTLADPIARFDCRRHACHDGGDHAIVVGRVLRAQVRPGPALAFSGGEYGLFTDGTP